MHFVKSSFNFYNELHSTVSRSLLYFYYTFLRAMFELLSFSALFLSLFGCTRVFSLRLMRKTEKVLALVLIVSHIHVIHFTSTIYYKPDSWNGKDGFLRPFSFGCFCLFLWQFKMQFSLFARLSLCRMLFCAWPEKVDSFVVLDRWSCTLVFTCFLFFCSLLFFF